MVYTGLGSARQGKWRDGRLLSLVASGVGANKDKRALEAFSVMVECPATNQNYRLGKAE